MLPHGPALSQEIPSDAIPLFERIWAGHSNISVCAYYLEYLALHMKPSQVVPALRFLLRQGYTGARFVALCQEDCARSGLELLKFVRMHLEHDKKVKPIYRGDLS